MNMVNLLILAIVAFVLWD